MNLFRPLLTIAIAFSMVIPLAAQYIIVDHQSVKEFDKIPDQYRIEAAAIPMLFMDRSVGANISSYLDCLASDWASARSYCKKYDHRDSIYAVDPSEVNWKRVWDRSLWRYETWPSGCSEDVNCLIQYMEPRLDSFKVMGCQFSYLAVLPGSTIADPVKGFFGSAIGKNHAKVLSDYAAAHSDKKIIWWTTSLARGIGTQESQQFNEQMRDYAIRNNLILFDVADILSHDPAGKPCYDNRDGITYLDEANPDDHLDIPAICPQYTTETEGGHLGAISAGGIRVAKAFWVLMAKIAGWIDVSQNENLNLASMHRSSVKVFRDQILLNNDSDKMLQLSFSNLFGQKVLETSISPGKSAISTGNLPPGIYFITTSPATGVMRVIIE
ncbi:MAG: hypothetical protein U0V49_08730 [Saprospiraceae bacterium]